MADTSDTTSSAPSAPPYAKVFSTTTTDATLVTTAQPVSVEEFRSTVVQYPDVQANPSVPSNSAVSVVDENDACTATSTAVTSSNRLNGKETIALILGVAAFIIQLACIISNAVLLSKDYIKRYYATLEFINEEYGYRYNRFAAPAGIASTLLGAVSFFFWFIATPIMFFAGRGYVTKHQISLDYKIIAWAVASWIIYICNFISMVGFFSSEVLGLGEANAIAWNLSILWIHIIQYFFMLVYTERVRQKCLEVEEERRPKNNQYHCNSNNNLHESAATAIFVSERNE